MKTKKRPALKVGDRLPLEIVEVDESAYSILPYCVSLGDHTEWVNDTACPPEAFTIERAPLSWGDKIRVEGIDGVLLVTNAREMGDSKALLVNENGRPYALRDGDVWEFAE